MTQQPTIPAPPSPAAPTSVGPRPGEKVRHPAAVVIFSIITLGIYHLYWIYQVFRELKERTGQGIGPVAGLLIALAGFVGLVFVPLVNLFVLPAEVGSMYARAGHPKPVRGVSGFWNLIPLVGSIIWIVKVQHALNRAWSGEVTV